MKKLFSALLIFLCVHSFAQETDDEYYDFGTNEGITVFGDSSLSKSKETEAMIIDKLKGLPKERVQFIKEDLLIGAGFRNTATVKYRKTSGKEKTSSVLRGAFHAAFGFMPKAPKLKHFSEVEYGELPAGEFYSFDSVIYESKLKDVSPDVKTLMELEYMLQIEFCNGIVIEKQNLNYYTDKNINKFEKLALSLPDNIENIKPLKDRYLHKELPKVKASLERYKNPNEYDLLIKKNLPNFNYKK
ncbi:MAG: hypothetical protein Ta2F_11940 [Termitinemataceae bacterium]|nr:MAG: hypothetical protein Ta2F_11940 [Termitinemataceae bacterium]